MSEPSPSPVQGKNNDPSGIRRLTLGFALSVFAAIVVYAVASLIFLVPPIALHGQALQLHSTELNGVERRIVGLEARVRQLTQALKAAERAGAQPAAGAESAPAVELPLIGGAVDAGVPAKPK